jgi:hypothetical protein
MGHRGLTFLCRRSPSVTLDTSEVKPRAVAFGPEWRADWRAVPTKLFLSSGS